MGYANSTGVKKRISARSKRGQPPLDKTALRLLAGEFQRTRVGHTRIFIARQPPAQVGARGMRDIIRDLDAGIQSGAGQFGIGPCRRNLGRARSLARVEHDIAPGPHGDAGVTGFELPEALAREDDVATLPDSIAALVAQLEAGLVATGHADDDMSALARAIRGLSGLEA